MYLSERERNEHMFTVNTTNSVVSPINIIDGDKHVSALIQFFGMQGGKFDGQEEARIRKQFAEIENVIVRQQ